EGEKTPELAYGKQFPTLANLPREKMTDDKHMNPDDQPLTDSVAEQTTGEQDLGTDAATPEAGASQGASRTETELADL
nr:hypothetical protein [Tanacetum cinerariifolium]